MIGWLDIDVPPGFRLEGIYDFDFIHHKQPCIIIRKATKEEYIEYYKSMNNDKIDRPLEYLEGKFFYEISTD